MYHLYLRHSIFLNVLNGDANQRNEVSGRLNEQMWYIRAIIPPKIDYWIGHIYCGGSNLGFSLGSSRALPAGLFLASSSVIISNSSSTFPFILIYIVSITKRKDKHKYLIYGQLATVVQNARPPAFKPLLLK